MSFPDEYSCYFIAILPQYRTVKAFNILMNGLFDLVTNLAKEDIFIKEWCTNAFTSEGLSMCKSLGMKYYCDHQFDKGKIYYTDFIPLPDIRYLKKHPELVSLYKTLL